jgi:hypothetical protein
MELVNYKNKQAPKPGLGLHLKFIEKKLIRVLRIIGLLFLK